MSGSQYVTIRIQNAESVSLTVVVKDPDGNEHTVQALAPGAEVTLLTPANATWSFKFTTGDGDDMAPLNPSNSKGKGQGIMTPGGNR